MPVGFQPPSRIEIEYRKAIQRAIVSSIPRPSADLTVDEWLEELAAISRSQDLAEMAAAIAGSMVRWVNVHNARTWREASARSQRSQMLYRLLQQEMQGPVGNRFRELVNENARLISSIPQEIAGYLNFEIGRAQQQGARPETIAKMLANRFPTLTQSRINLLARTETSKASTALTRARSEELQLPAYEWLTVEDARVRPSHRNLNGVIVFWEDPPSPEALIGIRSTLGHYNSGDCPNCRCTQRVILSLDDVNWPHRVYRYGNITRMTRANFASMSGIESRAAA